MFFCHLGIDLVTFSIDNQQREPKLGLIAYNTMFLGCKRAYIVNVQYLRFVANMPALLTTQHNTTQQLNRRPSFLISGI